MSLTEIVKKIEQDKNNIFKCRKIVSAIDHQSKYIQLFSGKDLIAEIKDDPNPIKVCESWWWFFKGLHIKEYFCLRSLSKKYNINN